MIKVNQIILGLEKFAGTLALGLMFCLISLNIVFRYFLNSPIFFAEELSNFLFVWTAFLSCAYVVGHNGHIKVTFFIHFFGPKVQLVVSLLMDVLLVILFACLAPPCWRVLETLCVSAAMRLPEKFVYAIIPVILVFSVLHLMVNIIGNLKNIVKKRKGAVE